MFPVCANTGKTVVVARKGRFQKVFMFPQLFFSASGAISNSSFQADALKRLQVLTLAILSLPLVCRGAGQTAHAQTADDGRQTHQIAGLVLDPSGASIPNAHVMLLGKGVEALAEATSDPVGAFHFDGI